MLKAAEEQLLCELKNEVLEANMDLLSRNLEPSRHFGYLRSASVLNSEDQETINNQPTRRQRAERLVDILRTKGPRAFDALCGSLEKDRTQLFLLSELNLSLEREIGERRARLKLNNVPLAQHVHAHDLPLPNLQGVMGKSHGYGYDSLPLQYSVEEEDDGNSLAATSQTAALACEHETADDSLPPNDSNC